MRVTLFLAVLALVGCSQTSAPASTYSGYYETDRFEHSTFSPSDRNTERWWLVGDLSCAFLDFNQEQSRPWRRVFIEVQGDLSPPGQYGHLGSYRRKLSVKRVVSCRPLREGEKVGA